MQWWDALVEEKIRRARQEGAWERSPYAGRRVPLPAENPFVPRAWWAAFHLLETHDLLPAWVQRGRWLRAALRAWRAALRRTLRAYPPGHPRRTAALQALHDEAQTLNAHIRDYNLSRPWGSAALAPLDWEAEQAAAQAPEEEGP